MGAASLHLYPRDRRLAIVASVLFATVLLGLVLLVCVAIAGATTVDASLADARLVAPFRWTPLDPEGLA